MRVVILGGSGMLGQALIREGLAQGHEILAPARYEVNLLNDLELEGYLHLKKPSVVINAAAWVDFTECEENPRSTYMVNARPVAILATICRDLNIDLVQISSDQCAHPLVNEYGRSKAAGECFALSYENALVVRTNIVGLKNLAWAFNAFEKDEECVLYSNYIISSIDIWSFSRALFDILKEPSFGIINLASRDHFTKELFFRSLAEGMGVTLTHAKSGTMKGRHADLRLDVTETEKWLGYPLPTMHEVIQSILKERQNDANWKAGH